MNTQHIVVAAAAGVIITACSYLKGRPNGRIAEYVGTAVLAALGWFIGIREHAEALAIHPVLVGVMAAWLGTAWVLWRGLAPDLFGETLAPPAGAYGPVVARQAVAFLFLGTLWPVWFIAIPAITIHIALATWAAMVRGREHRAGRNIGKTTELLQGLSMGAAVAISGAFL